MTEKVTFAKRAIGAYEVFLDGVSIGHVCREAVIWYPFHRKEKRVPNFKTRRQTAAWLVIHHKIDGYKNAYMDGLISGMALAEKVGLSFSEIKPELDRWQKNEG